MKKIILLFIILLFPLQTYAKDETIKIWNSTYSFEQAYNKIDSIFEKKYWNDFEKKVKTYIHLKRKLLSKDSKSKKINSLINLFDYSIIKTKNDRKNFYSKIQKVKIGESTKWKNIFAYYKWDPKNWYYWIFANMHGWYEYWTYNTAIYLLNKLYNTDVDWWFVIPTLNPDWLQYYFDSDKKYQAYLEARVNANNIDLNRNFCTNNFELKDFNKNWYNISTWIDWCNSEIETKVVINTLQKYNFTKIISLHSQGNIIFVPDNSFDDKRVIDFWNQVSKRLGWYIFDTTYKDQRQKQIKIELFEIDEWWIWEYTWTMETYIYEKYNIPVLLIELKKHWETEKNIINIIKDM